jgi:SPP1 gp7 family putative phage head morphogenesis protein
MQIRNETEIQLMKILYKTQKKKPTKNLTSKRAYPFGIENELYRKLKGFFKPLTDYVNKYLDENLESLLRGDSTEIRLDTIPGDSFRNMIYNLENWMSVYMPDISDLPEDSNNNVILTSLGKTADEAKKFGDKEFTRIIEKGIHVTPPISSPWWEDMKNSWAEDNYTLITSNAKKYVSQINTLTEQAIVNGLSPAKLKEQIKKATEGLSDKHCKLLARDQMGKLNGQITEAQMQEVGLDLYVWSTSYDDRVRDSHALMEGLLCRWDDASVCSYDNGKTWVARPSGAVDLHPGQDIQCRCVPLAFYPELEAEMQGVSLNSITEDLPDVQDTINDDFIKNKIDKLEDLGHGDVKNIIPMEYKEFLTEASKIYNEQRKMGEQIYIEKMVDLSDIVTRQEWLDKDTLIDFIKYDKSKEKGDLIRAVYYKNKYMLIDGNHRVAMAILKGGKRIKIAVLNPIKK